MTAPGAEPPPEDHSLKIAKIDRSKAIWAAVITGVLAIVAAGVTAYFAGKKDGTTAAPAASTVVSVSTQTVTVSARAPLAGSSAPATNAAAGDTVSLLDLPDVGDYYKKFTKGFPYVGGQRQENAMFVQPCSAGAAFDLDGKHATFRATVAVADSTNADVKVELTVSLDGAVQQSPFTVYKGHTADIAVDVRGGRQLRLDVSSSPACFGDGDQLVLINPVLGN